MRVTILLAAAALTACSGSEVENQVQPEPNAAAEPERQAQAQAPVAAEVLTSEGWGPLRIGMTSGQVTGALGADSDPEAVGGPEPEACDEYRPARAPAGMLVMIEEGRLTRISVLDQSQVRTEQGLGLGSTAAEVRRAYGNRVSAVRHQYVGPPAEYLTIWTRGAPANPDQGVEDPAARGIVYEIGEDGRVQRISAGGPSIQYVEGCS